MMALPTTSYTIEIPELLEKQIRKRGYDVKSWLQLQLQSLLEEVKQEKIADLIKNKTQEITDHVDEVKSAIKVI